MEGIELHFRQFGDDAGSSGNILLVHGFAGSTFSWRHVFPALELEGYRVIAVDLPGFGLSERDTSFAYTSATRAELLWSLLNSIKPDARWHLVGHSMGGGTVTAMVLQKPELVESLVLVAGAIPGNGSARSTWLFRYPPVSRWVRQLTTRYFLAENNVYSMLTSAYGRPPDPDEFAGYYQPLLIENSDASLAAMLKVSDPSIKELLSTVDQPALLIWGEKDSWVPLTEGTMLNKFFPHAELVVLAGEGHCPMETAPGIFNNFLLDFLKRGKKYKSPAKGVS
ncbi:MAG: alpha/beta hydrolase [Dethiobacteria bacterium]|nr:alpha/beta hydrolase [Dethiobacteria bacterium]